MSLQARVGAAIRRALSQFGKDELTFTAVCWEQSVSGHTDGPTVSLQHDAYLLRLGEPGKLTLPDEQRRAQLNTDTVLSSETHEQVVFVQSAIDNVCRCGRRSALTRQCPRWPTNT
jgi:hypothetical protein